MLDVDFENGGPAREATRMVVATVNGRQVSFECEDRSVLLDVLREELHLKGSHIGCRNGDCGACTCEVNGRIIKSCLMMAPAVQGAEIVTVEGLGTVDRLSAIQRAFWEKDGFQCGFCLPGQLFAAKALLEENPHPTEDEIRHALQGNLCRCTGYQKMIDAIQAVADGEFVDPELA